MVGPGGPVARRRAETLSAEAKAPFLNGGGRVVPLRSWGGVPTPFLRGRFEAPGCEGNVRVLWPQRHHAFAVSSRGTRTLGPRDRLLSPALH